MDDTPTILLRWCKQRSGIRLRQDFLQSWKNQRESPISDTEAAYKELVDYFLCKDLSISSEPVIPEDFSRNPVETFPPGHLRQGGGVVLQIQDTDEITTSTFSQLNTLNEGGNLPHGVLRWTLTDGSRQVQAMEMEHIPELSLKTPFGCKLLIQNCTVKRGMLFLTKKSIKVLGGDLPELYGGDMTKELEKRFKEKLGIVDSSTTPVPGATNSTSRPTPSMPSATNSANRPTPSTPSTTSTSSTIPNRSFTATNTNTNRDSNSNRTSNINNSSNFTNNSDSFTQPPPSYNSRIAEELDGLDDIDMDQLDIDEEDISMTLVGQSNENIPSDDDDFVATQPIPVARPTINFRKSQNTRPEPNTAPLNKRARKIEPSSTETEKEEPEPTVKKEKVPEVEEEMFSFTMSDIESDDEPELDDQGRAHISFDKLYEILSAMDKNAYTGNIADIVVVKAKFMRLAKIKYSTISGFYVIFDIASPDGSPNDIAKVVISHALFVELLQLKPEVLDDMPNLMKSRSEIRKLIGPFEKNMKLKLAELVIDLSLTENPPTENGQTTMQITAPCNSFKLIE